MVQNRIRVAGIAVLFVIGATLWWWATTSERGREPLSDRETSARGGDSIPAPGLDPASTVEHAMALARERIVTETAPAPVGEKSRPPVRIGARLVDERGSPLALGRLSVRLVDGECAAEGRDDGEVEVEFDPIRIRSPRFALEASAPGRVRRLSDPVERAALESAGAIFLGEIMLGPGGALAGRVVDESGAPVPEAAVSATRTVTEPSAAQLAMWRVRPPWSDFGDGIRPSTKTDAGGRYLLDGVPAGAVTLFAGDGRHLTDRESGLVVLPGATANVRDLVLRVPEDGERIAGIVRGEDGGPFSGAFVRIFGEEYGSQVSTDTGGRFEFLVLPDRTYAIRADDPSNMRRASKDGVRAGELSLELRFGAAGSLDVLARDAEGPVQSFRVIVLDDERRGIGSSRPMVEPKFVRLDRPEERFNLYVVSTEHLTLELGPYEPGSAPERLELVLERKGGIAGVVLADDRPLADAEVHAHRALLGSGLGELDEGFVTFVYPFVMPRVRTDADGRFFLPLEPGRHRVHAEGGGRARASTDWLEVVGTGRIEGVELRFPVAGRIEGRILTAPGAECRGLQIGASSGDGHVLLTRTSEEGSFAFEALAPGPWQVHRLRPGALISEGSCRSLPEGHQVRWDLDVAPGSTAIFDIDARDEALCTLEGRLTFGGVVPLGWSAYVWSPSGPRSATLDSTGRFALRVAKPGKSSLSFSSAWSAVNVGLSVEFELQPGANFKEIDVPSGALTIENLPAAPEVDASFGSDTDWPEYALMSSEGALRWHASLQETPERRVILDHVPAGKLVLRFRGEGQSPEDSRHWPVLAELELAPGEHRFVVLE